MQIKKLLQIRKKKLLQVKKVAANKKRKKKCCEIKKIAANKKSILVMHEKLLQIKRATVQKTLMVNFTTVVSNFCLKVTFFLSNGDNTQDQKYITGMQK